MDPLYELIYDLPRITHEILEAEAKRQGLPSYPNAVADAQRILRERAKAPKCPKCGSTLDTNGCCYKWTCVVK